ncbi:tRNA (guanine-N1)-methyltransferase [filamentous cyanobacterium CCP5]|nr:tRNA (guanine-N1)-methyltransferase [filamentous cyanobacterium CCP5]
MLESWQQEGQAHFQTAGAFYRPQSRRGRDLGVLAATLYRRDHGQLRVLDAMSGCGVRPLRYQLEANADWVWANEGNPELGSLLSANLAALRPDAYAITHQDANQVFFSCYQQRDYYDLVDVDNFGGPAPYANSALWATRLGGLVYLTSTDGRATSGRDPNRSLQTYGAYARSHPAIHEQGLRLLLGHGIQQAAARGLGAEPIFAYFNGEVHRVMLRLTPGGWQSDRYGFLGYCHGCGQFHTVGWRQLGQVSCRCGCGHPPVLSGPMWLGPLHDHKVIGAMAALAQDWGWPETEKLLRVMAAETPLPPYYYLLGDIGRRGRMDIPPRQRLIAALHRHGFQASPTHLSHQAIKTTAPLADCIAIARSG